MASRQFTIDEWFYNYLLDPEKFRVTAKFFLTVLEVCDRVCIRKDTPLQQKFFDLDKELSTKSPECRQVAKSIVKLFIPNSEKMEWINEDIEIPEVKTPLPRKDHYLIKLCLATGSKILITSDKKLKTAIQENEEVLGITVYMAHDFMKEYLKHT